MRVVTFNFHYILPLFQITCCAKSQLLAIKIIFNRDFVPVGGLFCTHKQRSAIRALRKYSEKCNFIWDKITV
jgi:hypothetical protein